MHRARGRRVVRLGRAALGVTLLAVLGAGLTIGGTESPAIGATHPTVTKVLTIIEENHSLYQMRSGMPYLFGLAQRYAYATNWTATTHPSLPNYLAIAGGSTFGVADDAAPSVHAVTGDSVFDRAIAAGGTAKTYAERMGGNCALTSSGRYAVKHNPWAYFSGAAQRAHCRAYDVPAGTPSGGALAADIAAGRLPTAGLLVPDLCNDAHDCSLSTADNDLRGWLLSILAGPDFTSGRLVVVVTADEDDHASGNKVLTVVLHPTLSGAHKVVATHLTHYSLTRYYGQVSRTAPLRSAATAPDMRAAFNLP